MYLKFRSDISAATVDYRAPGRFLTLEFSLRLPQSLSNPNLMITVTSSLIKASSQPIVDLEFALCNISDNILADTEPEQMCNLPITARDTIVPASSTSSLLVASSNLFTTPRSLPPVTLPSLTHTKIDVGPSIFSILRLTLMSFLVLTQPYSVLLLATRTSALPRIRSISIIKSSHSVISVVSIFFVIPSN